MYCRTYNFQGGGELPYGYGDNAEFRRTHLSGVEVRVLANRAKVSSPHDSMRNMNAIAALNLRAPASPRPLRGRRRPAASATFERFSVYMHLKNI
ncbi:hypothetical protein EVAR_29813_1 [Eumeta japonica]|uniref:Uncharacterized protein n=1 Tax=Eumeta variegata TaxID=151549 RepID=A0A4C1XSI7_EUMVA|nr:hypothetical protein EVAR_29813_1 [Eumeta japonica]